MGAAADGALEAGGRVEGVILRKFWKVRHRGLHVMRGYETFALRKARCSAERRRPSSSRGLWNAG